MTKLQEIIEREAARDEAEEPDETPGLEPNEDEAEEAEAEEAPAEPEPITEADLKRISGQIEKEDDRHEKALRKILGDLWEGRETCPLCMQEGFVVPAEPGTFDQEQRYAVLAAMGDLTKPKLKPHPRYERCGMCDGWGMLEAFSRKEEYATENCDACQGFGRVEKQQPATNGNYGAPAQPQVAWTPPPPEASQNLDVWGRPWGHKDWGQNPAEVNAV